MKPGEGAMSNGRQRGGPATYRIEVQGRIGAEWSDWFDGFVIIPRADGQTLLTGSVVDQAALYGVLLKLHNLGLILLLVKRTTGML